jgi:hypothetical protein
LTQKSEKKMDGFGAIAPVGCFEMRRLGSR